MVEVVVTFAESDQRGNNVIARGVSVIEWLTRVSVNGNITRRIWTMTNLLTQPMGERIDTEGGLLHK